MRVAPDPGPPRLRVISQEPKVPSVEDGGVEDPPRGRREATNPKPLPRRTFEASRPVDKLGAGLPSGGKEGLKMIGLPDVVVVQEGDPVSAGQLEAPVGGLRSGDHPAEERVLGVVSPFPQVLESDTRVAQAEDAGRSVIGAGVSDDDDFSPAISLGESRHQGPADQKWASVVRRDDDRDQRFSPGAAHASEKATEVEPGGIQQPT